MKMPQYVEKERVVEYIEKQLAVVRLRAPAWLSRTRYWGLIRQIEYLRSAVIDRRVDRSKLHKMDFGGGGASMEPLEREDPDLFSALGRVGYIADRVANGLKIDELP